MTHFIEPDPRPPADNIEEEEQAATGAESLDEDRLGSDPVADGYDAADEWGESAGYGTTETESRRGEPLEDRLDQEEPDVTP